MLIQQVEVGQKHSSHTPPSVLERVQDPQNADLFLTWSLAIWESCTWEYRGASSFLFFPPLCGQIQSGAFKKQPNKQQSKKEIYLRTICLYTWLYTYSITCAKTTYSSIFIAFIFTQQLSTVGHSSSFYLDHSWFVLCGCLSKSWDGFCSLIEILKHLKSLVLKTFIQVNIFASESNPH